MNKDKSPVHGGGLPPPPPSGCFSGFSATATTPFNVKSESPSSPAPYPLPPVPAPTSNSASFSLDISRMPDNPPRNRGHRRAHSEILTLPDDISSDNDLGIVRGVAGEPPLSNDMEEDVLSMYLDMDKFNPPSSTSGFEIGEASASAPALGCPASSAGNIVVNANERPRVRHQHSMSMDGSTTIKTEMLVSGSEEISASDTRKAMSAAKLAELALIDPKRAKRIWANRQSAARSKERKARYIFELEKRAQTLQTEATSLSAQLSILQRDASEMNAENNKLRLRVQTMEQQVQLQDALNDALKEEIQNLRVMIGQTLPNGGGGQQFHPNIHAMPTLLAAQQFQQLQIRSLMQHNQLQQRQRQLQQPLQQPQLQPQPQQQLPQPQLPPQPQPQPQQEQQLQQQQQEQ